MSAPHRIVVTSASEYQVLHVVTGEGGRFALLICPRCAATVTTHPTIDTTALHTEWHRQRGEQ